MAPSRERRTDRNQSFSCGKNEGRLKKIPFKPGVYHDNQYAKFHFCKKCGKRLKEGQKIFRRSVYGGENRSIGYYCVKCHDSLYI